MIDEIFYRIFTLTISVLLCFKRKKLKLFGGLQCSPHPSRHFTSLWHVCFLSRKKPMRPYFFCNIPCFVSCWKMAKYTLKIVRCKHSKILKYVGHFSTLWNKGLKSNNKKAGVMRTVENLRTKKAFKGIIHLLRTQNFITVLIRDRLQISLLILNEFKWPNKESCWL